MPILDDITLITLIQSDKRSDNDRAFKYFYQDFYSIIEKNILANSGDEQDAEDIFQDGLIVLYHQIKKNQLHLTCSLSTYFYSICRNLWLKRLRKSSRVVELSDTLQQYVAVEESHLKTLEKTEEKKMVASFLDQLNESCRQILFYFYFEKIRMTEIAERMGLSGEQVAKNKKASCMKKLKALIKQAKYFKP